MSSGLCLVYAYVICLLVQMQDSLPTCCAGMCQACVALLCEVEAFDDAVGLALSFDRGLAEDVARRPADDSTRRQLWLAIAKHLFAGATEARSRQQCL